MDQPARTFFELKFRAHYLEAKAGAFQDLFASIMSKAHPEDFFPCRPWGNIGDRKNDGYLKSQRMLFQVYAPNEMRLASTLAKVETDFQEALPFWREYFDTWVFVHNAASGLPADVIAKLLELERAHAPVKVTHWGFDELLKSFHLLRYEAMLSLYGAPPAPTKDKGNRARALSKQAEALAREGKRSESVKMLKKALDIAKTDGDEGEEVEILSALALSVGREGPVRKSGDRQHYLLLAEQKAAKLKSAAAKVIYLRARAAAFEDSGNLAEAEEVYRAAIDCSQTTPDGAKNNLAIQGCVVRSSLVHLLCRLKRFDDARPVLAESEAYARAHKDEADGELLQAALMAGIHLAVDTGSDDDAVQRIGELEQAATTGSRAQRIGGDLVNAANQASHRDSHRVAIAAADAAVRVARRADDRSGNFLVGALYTKAMVTFRGGDDGAALREAEAILDLCKGQDGPVIRQAAQQLIAEIKRRAGDSQTAVDLTRRALRVSDGRPENSAFSKLALARALSDNGQTEEALKHASEAWTLLRPVEPPAEVTVDVLRQLANYASQLGAVDLVADALTALDSVPSDTEELADEKARVVALTQANGQLRTRLLEVADAGNAAATNVESLAAANALVTQPLLKWWDDVLDTGPEYVAGAYEFWGRGNFARILGNTRQYPNSFNITVEVRSLDDVKRAIRLWGLYADLLVLLWKGPTESAWTQKMLVPLDFDAPGGLGYMVFLGTVVKKAGSQRRWSFALGYGSTLPHQVVMFLATEARSLIETGRLVIVPAVGTGCVNPGHGPFEQLLAEAANAIPSVRSGSFATSPIGHIPFSPDAPFSLLADLADSESERLRKLRLLLLRRSRSLTPTPDIDIAGKELSLEIDDALRDLEDRNNKAIQKKGLAKAKEPLSGVTAPFRTSGARLGARVSDSPFAPLLVLQSLGYGWRVESPDGSPSPRERFEPKGDEMIGAWLSPPESGWRVPVMEKDGEESS
jgi:tetratricopeptide (TPR) repeat protein